MRATMTVTTTKVATTTVTTTTTVTFFLLMWQGLLPIYLMYSAPTTGYEANDPTNQNPRMFDLAWTCCTSEGVIKRLRAPKWAPGASMNNRHGFGEP